jgi:hypothetical protein
MLLRLGILIAGSLDWRNEPYRVAWRKLRLIPEDGIPVRAPIRYGRLSRSNTYTMVFAPSSPAGQAKVRRCLHPVSSIADIVDEAKALWVAERPANSQPLAGRAHSADWGCVALLANPESMTSHRFLDDWAKRIALERNPDGSPTYDSTFYRVKGASAICNRGLLQIAWPTRCDSSAAFDRCDLLLATATRPTPDHASGDFPTPAVIAEAWNRAGNANYFRINRKHSLYSFEDEEIESFLRV